jgi:hypothetical protein
MTRASRKVACLLAVALLAVPASASLRRRKSLVIVDDLFQSAEYLMGEDFDWAFQEHRLLEDLSMSLDYSYSYSFSFDTSMSMPMPMPTPKPPTGPTLPSPTAPSPTGPVPTAPLPTSPLPTAPLPTAPLTTAPQSTVPTSPAPTAPQPTAPTPPAPTSPTPTPSTSTDTANCLEGTTKAAYLETALADVPGFSTDPATSEGKAFDWFVNTDTVDVCTYATLEQRYALAAFWFSTGGPGWTNATKWTTAAPECEWEFITCNQDGEVTSMAPGTYYPI